jgi:hypothetical protein
MAMFKFLAGLALATAMPAGMAAASSIDLGTIVVAGSICSDVYSSVDATASTSVSVGCSESASNSVWSVGGAASARASFGSIGVAVSSSAAKPVTIHGGANFTESYARADISDGLTFDVASGYFDIPLDVSGYSSSTIVAGEVGQETDDLRSILMSIRAIANGIDQNILSYILGRGLSAPAVLGSTGVTNFRVPIIDGRASIGLAMLARSECHSSNVGNTTCHSLSYFYSSTRFLAGSVYDIDGNLVRGANVVSDSGFDYLRGVAPHVSPVPLPAGLPLLFSALAGLVLAARRRRARASLAS